MAARFSKSRDASKLPLLSNNIAMRTGVSARKMSLIGLGSPSTTNSKSSIRRFGTAAPRASSTVVGTGTRCELTRTTSSEGLAPSSVFAFADWAGIGGGGGNLVACRGRSEAGDEEGLALAFFCLPDCEWLGDTIRESPAKTKARVATTAAQFLMRLFILWPRLPDQFGEVSLPAIRSTLSTQC